MTSTVSVSVSVPVIIRAVLPDRQSYVDYLTSELPEAKLCIDQTRNAMDTFLAALVMAGDGPALHMEDDALLCSGFREKVNTEIALHDRSVINFFSFRKDDVEIGSRWDGSFCNAQCFYLPPGYSRGLLAFAPYWKGREKHPTGLDLMVSDWLKARREKYRLHVPSLVDHRVCTSIIDPRRSSRRQSLTFEGTD
jgi:hypothetical protein